MPQRKKTSKTSRAAPTRRKRAKPTARARTKTARKLRGGVEPPEPRHVRSTAAIAGEAMRRGVAGPEVIPPRQDEIPGEEALRFGDPDIDLLGNEYVGEEAPGGTVFTPDQDRVDDIGRAVGVLEEDSGALRTSEELMERRDRRRAQADKPDTRDRD